MRSVWSFWSTPYLDGTGWHWRRPLHHLLAWGLSLRVAARHYPQTVLVTDTPGRQLLVDELGLPFSHVSTELDALTGCDPSLWAAGKLMAYGLQESPFVHLDADVFLWRPLPARLVTAPLLAQHPERWGGHDPWSGTRAISDALTHEGFAVPVEWQWARSTWGQVMWQANCGIFGGTAVEFIRRYAALALELVLDDRARAAWATIPYRRELNPVLEQFTLTACAEFHRSHPDSPYRGTTIRYLFPSDEAAYSRDYARRLGYTHLIGDTKNDASVTDRLEQRVEREDRALYRRCLAVAGG